MKKTILMALSASLLLGVIAFVACDDDDSAKSKTTFKQMEMLFSYEVSADLLEVADITFSYTDPAGVITEEAAPITTASWSKSFVATTLPASFSVKVSAVLKEGVTLSKEQYQLNYAWTDEFKEFRSDDKVHWHDGPDTERGTALVKQDPNNPDALQAEIQAALALMNRSFTYVVKADADGSGYEVEDND